MLSRLWYNADAETNRKGSERMALPAWVVEKWEQLSRENQAQARDYIEQLLYQQSRKAEASTRKLGPLKDRFEFIADDFNAPIDEFQEYM